MTQSFAPSPARPFTTLVALVTLFAMLVGMTPRPAKADTTSTLVTLLGAAAVATGIIISNNVRHKQAQARQQVGRTSDGGIVFGDGRIVYPDGRILYAGNGDGRRCSYDGEDERCDDRPIAYFPRRDRDEYRENNGRHLGWYKHHHRDWHNEDNQGDDRGNRGYHGDNHGNHGDD